MYLRLDSRLFLIRVWRRSSFLFEKMQSILVELNDELRTLFLDFYRVYQIGLGTVFPLHQKPMSHVFLSGSGGGGRGGGGRGRGGGGGGGGD